MFSYIWCFIIVCLWKALTIFTSYCLLYDSFFSALTVLACKNCLKVRILLSSIKLKNVCRYLLNLMMEIPTTQDILVFGIMVCAIILVFLCHICYCIVHWFVFCVSNIYSGYLRTLSVWNIKKTFYEVVQLVVIFFATEFIVFVVIFLALLWCSFL